LLLRHNNAGLITESESGYPNRFALIVSGRLVVAGFPSSVVVVVAPERVKCAYGDVVGTGMTVKAIFENGVLRPKTPLPLREHEEVEIEVKRVGESSLAADDDPTGWEAAQRFIGLWKDAPRRSARSLSEDHDEVLYRRK
jgi:hypothetical protein